MDQSSSFDPPPPAAPERWIDAEQAAGLLGIKRATLYAYVSRGQLRSRAQTGTRRRHYLRSDVERLRARSGARAGHGAVAAGALRWGEPVLESGLTEIRPDGPHYRGENAIALARRGMAFERVAEHLWGGADAFSHAPDWKDVAATTRIAMRHVPLADARPLDAMQLALPALALLDPQRLLMHEEPNLEVARRLIRRLVAAPAHLHDASCVRRALAAPTAASSFVLAMGLEPRRRHVIAVNAAMVLVADHELNPSSFAARVAASAGADLYACSAAALATLSGPRHGGMPDRVLALLDEIGQPEHAARTVGERLRRGDAIDGFGHPLYPAGDPRAPLLIELAHRLRGRDRRLRVLNALIESMRLVGADAPTLDVGLVALACALRLPAGGASALFAAGRVAGWIAHALEQRRAGYILRPRARYNPDLASSLAPEPPGAP